MVRNHPRKLLDIMIYGSTRNLTTYDTILRTKNVYSLHSKEWYLGNCTFLNLLSSRLQKTMFQSMVYIQFFSHFYVLEFLKSNYSIVFEIGHAFRKRHLPKRDDVLSWLRITLNLRGLVFWKVATIVNKSHAPKTGQYYPCTFLLFHAIHYRLQNLERSCKNRPQWRTRSQNHTFFGSAFVFLDLSKLMSRNSIPLSFQYRTVDQKTRHIQQGHCKCMILWPSNQMLPSVPLAMNESQTCAVANGIAASEILLGNFFPDHEENTPYDMFTDSRVYATEVFAQ